MAHDTFYKQKIFILDKDNIFSRQLQSEERKKLATFETCHDRLVAATVGNEISTRFNVIPSIPSQRSGRRSSLLTFVTGGNSYKFPCAERARYRGIILDKCSRLDREIFHRLPNRRSCVSHTFVRNKRNCKCDGSKIARSLESRCVL